MHVAFIAFNYIDASQQARIPGLIPLRHGTSGSGRA
jgi:hypothetical protein